MVPEHVQRTSVFRARSLWILFATACVFSGILDRTASAEDFVREFAPHDDLVRWVGFSPDGRILASSSWDHSIRFDDANSGQPIRTLKSEQDQNVWGAFSPDGYLFAAGSNSARIRIWNASTGALLHTINGPHTNAWGGGVSRDGKTIFSGGPEGNFVVWDAKRGSQFSLTKNESPIWWIAVAPDGNEVAVASGDGRVRVRDAKDGAQKRIFGDQKGGVYCITYSSDGSQIATAGADATTSVWNARSGERVHAFKHFGPVFAIAFSPDGKMIAAGGESATLKLYDVTKGSFVRTLGAHSEPIWTCAFSPRGDRIATAGADRRVLVWNWNHVPSGLKVNQSLPKSVDLRTRMNTYGLKVVQQHSRGTCSVHTMTRALEFAIANETKNGVKLSDEYLNWACNQIIGNTGPNAIDRGQFFEHLWIAFRRYGICPAAQMPFKDRFEWNYEPAQKIRDQAARYRAYQIYWHDITGPGVEDMDVVRKIKQVLASGWPVLAGSAHSVLVVGYKDDAGNPGGGRFIIADSGGGGFITTLRSDRLHSAIPYQRVKDYGFSWIQCNSAAASQ